MSEKTSLKGESIPALLDQYFRARPSHVVFATKRNGYWQDRTAEDCLQYIYRTMAGLQDLGFQPGDRVCIFSENREEWTLTDWSAQWLDGSTSAIYTTSSESDVGHILNECQAKFIFVSTPELLEKLGDLSRYPSVKAVILWDGKAEKGAVPILSPDEFLKRSLSEKEATELAARVHEDTVAILLYTSGTTGEPKGVELTQKSFVSNVHQMHDAIPLNDLSVTMSFLPLSHIYERSLQTTVILAGIKVCFAESIEKLVENISEIRPDMMIGVPRVFEKMYVKVQEKLRQSSPVKRLMAKLSFEIGGKTVPYRLKEEELPLGLKVPMTLADALVFRKIRAITGGRLRFFVSGGAPLSKEIAEFFFQMGITILEGYGLSETMILCVNRPGKIRFGTVGHAFKDTEFKIAEDGEILVRGPQIMRGYYKRPQQTAEVFTEDGFFRTGDIGELDDQGYLSITDRKKELIITAAGKNVAPQPIENRLKSFPFIEQVCLIGDQKKYLTALIVPNLEICQGFLKTKKQSIPKDLSACCEVKAVEERIKEIVDQVNEELGRYATLKYFRLIPRPFSIDANEMTPSMKLKRRVISKNFAKEIDSMYPPEERPEAI